MRHRAPFPFVFLNVAMTADGKIAPENKAFVPFGSKRDQEHLLELRAQADAVMAGARTVDLFPVSLGPGPKKYRLLRQRNGLAEYNLRVIVSGSGSINPRAKIFQHRFSPIIILVTKRISAAKLKALSRVADEVKIVGKKEINWADALAWLREKWKVKRLLCEGGGELNEALFRGGFFNELHLTICPVIFGGQHAPTLADGLGVPTLSQATEIVLQSRQLISGDLFLVYRKRKKIRVRSKAP